MKGLYSSCYFPDRAENLCGTGRSRCGSSSAVVVWVEVGEGRMEMRRVENREDAEAGEYEMRSRERACAMVGDSRRGGCESPCLLRGAQAVRHRGWT